MYLRKRCFNANGSKLTIRIFVTNYSETLANLLKSKLEEIISKYEKAKLKLTYEAHEQYWKYSELTICYLYIYCDDKIKVLDLIELFYINDWLYRESEVCNAENHTQTALSQSAVWSKNVSDEVFLDENVTWVEIVNWGWDN